MHEGEDVEFDLVIGDDEKKKAFHVTGPDGAPVMVSLRDAVAATTLLICFFSFCVYAKYILPLYMLLLCRVVWILLGQAIVPVLVLVGAVAFLAAVAVVVIGVVFHPL